MENNNLLQDGFFNESELTELINDFYNYYGNISGVQPQTTDIQAQNPSLNTNDTYCDFINELFAMDDEEYSTFDNQNYQQTPITPIPSNEQFTNNFDFIPTSNHCLPQSIPTQSIPDNYSYTSFNTVTFDSLQENTSNTCEIFKFEYRVISVPTTSPITPNTLITTTSNILEMRQLNYFSLINNLQMQSQL